MAARQEPYVIFNDCLIDNFQAKSFAPFPRLPLEIRIRIWTESILSKRLFQIVFDNKWPETFPELYTEQNQLGNIISGCPYLVRSPPSTEWSPDTLLRVNREASAVVRRVFRLRIPVPANGLKSAKALYICPENDIMWIKSDQRYQEYGEVLTTSFLHDLIAYDPKGVGIVHLAIHAQEHQVLLQRKPHEFVLPAQQSIKKMLSSSLQTIYLGAHSTRGMMGVFTSPQSQFHNNRSVPILPATRTFTAFAQDPRPIKADLTHLSVDLDPRCGVFRWRRFMANFGITRQILTRYILNMGFTSGSRDGFLETLKQEDESWLDWTSRCSQPIWGERMTKEEYEIQVTSLPQAAGVWIFPEDTFGAIPSIDVEFWMMYMVVDLSAFHPELWAFDLITAREEDKGRF